MLITKEQQEAWIANYSKTHNNDEILGFIDGIQKVMSIFNKNEGVLYPKSKLSDSFEILLSNVLKKFKGIFYVDNYDLYRNDIKLLTINPDVDSVSSITSKLIELDTQIINEDEGGGVAVATAGTVSGMGDVSSAQPSATPGGSDGSIGSGDYGNPLFRTFNKDGSKKLGGGKKSKKIKDFVSKNKSSEKTKVLNFDDYIRNNEQ